jgi:hypothetical protein
MTDHIVTKSLVTTTATTLLVCAVTIGKDAGIIWWATTMLCIYPFTHLAYRHLQK